MTQNIMKSRADILRLHYAQLVRKFGVWIGLISMVGFMIVPNAASAYSQVTTRSMLMSTSKPAGTSVTWTISFQPGAAITAGAVAFSICDQPWEVASSCVNTGGSNGAIIGSFSAGSSSTDFSSGWSTGTAGNCGTGTTNYNFCLYDASGKALAGATQESVVFTGNTNPSGTNKTFYVNIFLSTVAGAATVYSAPVNFGAVAASTGQELSVSATVQEALTFCVGATVASGCGSTGGAAVSLGTSSPCPILGSSYTCTGTSQMDANTNAATGYAIYYDGTSFTNPSTSYTIGASSSTPFTATTGTESFGLAGTAISGTGSGVFYSGPNTNYCFASGTGCVSGNSGKYAYVYNGTGNTTNTEVASAAGPTSDNVYTLTYSSDVSTTTKPGVYTATVDYICTGTF